MHAVGHNNDIFTRAAYICHKLLYSSGVEKYSRPCHGYPEICTYSLQVAGQWRTKPQLEKSETLYGRCEAALGIVMGTSHILPCSSFLARTRKLSSRYEPRLLFLKEQNVHSWSYTAHAQYDAYCSDTAPAAQVHPCASVQTAFPPCGTL